MTDFCSQSGRLGAAAVVAWAVACLGSCTGGEPSGEAWVLLGSGETRFEPVGDGDDVVLAPGLQGGWHLWASVRAGGFGPRARLQTTVEPAGWDGPRQRGSRPIALEPVEGGPLRQYVGSPVVLSYAPCFADRPVRLEIRLTDDDGRTATDERIVVPRAPATPEMGACTWIP